ncbi:phage tail tube protein [Desulfopila aestuarii]|uniref:Uncharacterized protein n=1 Tax=Desulfopila aestuarii DSM 18488 TaxID=1121416 RepID=A0A1M7YJQ7_9BACT|nr:hypothetical protein [Desulfopila aestuarii]SHO52847.1 hypothetical protein SAMN02745220_04799 [Desulfopila aestuarii DSM 18488]
MGKSRTFYGCLYLAKVDDAGVLLAKYQELGEAYPLTVTIKKEVVTILGRTCLTNGKVIDSKEKPAETGGSLTLLNYTADNVAKALDGMVSTRSVSQTTLTAEPVTLGKFREYAEIGVEDLSSVVVKDVTDTTTYTANVDYSLNAVLGLIAPLEGGAIAEDAVVHVTAAGAANTDSRVTIGSGSSAKYALKGNLVDDFSGDSGKFFLRKVRVVSKADVVVLSAPDTEREALQFDLIPELPTGQTDYGYFDGLPL